MSVIVGERFGRWTAIMDTGERTKNRQHIWLCKCDCGTVRNVDSRSLTSGRSKSCGCWRAERTARDNQTEKIKNQRRESGKANWQERKKIIGIENGTNISKCLSSLPRADSSTGVRGVMRGHKGGYYAQVVFQGKRHCSYGYATIVDAKKARDKLWEEYVKPYIEEYKEAL